LQGRRTFHLIVAEKEIYTGSNQIFCRSDPIGFGASSQVRHHLSRPKTRKRLDLRGWLLEAYRLWII